MCGSFPTDKLVLRAYRESLNVFLQSSLGNDSGADEA